MAHFNLFFRRHSHINCASELKAPEGAWRLLWRRMERKIFERCPHEGVSTSALMSVSTNRHIRLAT
ncbi:hypothetical protein BT69DRAFT_1123136 [Atractiella rhizophila]|nr:hypothetical protein BT69DRAFT_1123136 [Atractiella rhizophila]